MPEQLDRGTEYNNNIPVPETEWKGKTPPTEAPFEGYKQGELFGTQNPELHGTGVSGRAMDSTEGTFGDTQAGNQTGIESS